MQETRVRSLGWEGPLEEAAATPSSILAWKIPRTKEPEGLQSTGSQRVGHTLSTHTYDGARGNNLAKGTYGETKNEETGLQTTAT